MSGLQRYDHARMIEHATQQANLVTHLQGLQQDANNQIASIAEVWTQHGSNAAQECHAQISLAFGRGVRHHQSTRHGDLGCVGPRGDNRFRFPPPASALSLNMSVAVGARLSTSTEGLWLTAALAGSRGFPWRSSCARSAEWKQSTPIPEWRSSNRPGCAIKACWTPTSPDWVMTLGRPDIELNVAINVAEADGDRLAGPPPCLYRT